MNERVCHITTVHDPFDPRIFHKEMRSLADVGYTMTLLAVHDRHEVVNGIEVIPFERPRNRVDRMIRLGWCAYRAALRQRADLYHFHDPEFLPWAWLLRRVHKKKVIYDVHEYYPESVLMKTWLPRVLRTPAAWGMRMVQRALCAKLSGVVAVNDDLAARFRAVNPDSISLHNYPRTEMADRLAGLPRGNAATSVYVGGASRDRGYDVLLRAVDLLRGESKEFSCTVVGPVDRTGLCGEALLIERSLVTDGSLRLVGSVPHEEVVGYLAEAAVAWLPWRGTPNNRLGLPTKLFEYMAAGLPVVASSIGFIRTVIEETGGGDLIPEGDPEALASATFNLLQNPGEAARMGTAGRKAVLERMNWSHEEPKLIRLYQRVLEHVARGPA